ncbi:long polar fimbrial protein LpfE [Trabulsiella odontotermitis]|uniref:long polar fimbrial protein LpfE n=1 Tax=Trabulsiella odontotermitis TaxID=379893 RepID=UPI0024B6F8C3|nr:long polar fimbrial protein LpfE [Trabulsiella odontotermitis]WHP33243.1 long polar fimbrial protein LpfE [Trabulsiella odontotermitis]
MTGLCCLPLLALAKTDIGSPGDLHFSLSIRQGTCELVQSDFSVEMGEVSLARGQNVGDALNSVPFTLGLQHCGDVVTARVTMDGAADTDNPDLFALDKGGADGVALKIVDANGKIQKPKSTDATSHDFAITPTQGMISLAWTASYVVTHTPVKSGAANALVNFSVEYE